LFFRPQHRNHVWAYDFVEDRTRDGRKFRMLTVIDELTRERLAIEVKRRLQPGCACDLGAAIYQPRGPRSHSVGQWRRIRR
jgi:putative transposase